MQRDPKCANAFEHVGNQIGVGDTGLLLIADEEDNRPLNQLIMNELGGDITRFDYDEVEAEIETAKKVEESTKARVQEDWKTLITTQKIANLRNKIHKLQLQLDFFSAKIGKR